jgi:hypothetical protein
MNANDPLYIAYRNARKPDGVVTPPNATYALRLARGTDNLAEEIKALGVDLDHDNKSDLALDEEEVVALGFDPERLTARVRLSYDDGIETIQDKLSDCGFTLSDVDYDDEHCEGRPDHTASKVDLNPHRRGGVFWLTTSEDDVCVPKGMSRGVRAETIASIRTRLADKMATYAQNYVEGDFGPYYVSVEVLWDGEVVGDSGLGGVEAEHKDLDKSVAEIIIEHGMLAEALIGAAKWADTALERLPPRALRALSAQPE